MSARAGGPGFSGVRSATISGSKLFSLGVRLAFASAAPLAAREHGGEAEGADGMATWLLWVISMSLVLIGGVFAGLTIALMGQDSIYLQVISGDPLEPQCKNAGRVLKLLQKGKHWVLVTLLLSNVIVNESLPVVLDRVLGGGVAAIVGSTVLIVIFGEIVPQSVCVRFGLQIGAIMSKPVLLLMYLTAPISWPIAKLLDYLLGEDHGVTYKRSGLKTLVSLHRSIGEAAHQLTQDEVTIVTSVLDLKEKKVAAVMTPMDDVFTLSENHVLDEKTMDKILSSGYSRIPIYRAGSPTDFVGMLLVKTLITYDPEDRIPVKDVQLGAIVETRPETSCLDIINFFQEGKSHLVLVSEFPGEDHGALGVVTLEDVIEELIGEEIVDESDVYVDVHKAVRRLQPAPRAKRLEAAAVAAAAKKTQSADGSPANGNSNTILVNIPEDSSGIIVGSPQSDTGIDFGADRPCTAIFMKRRSSEDPDGATTEPVKASLEEMKRQLRLGPANRAANPLSNKRENVFKIKQATSGSGATTGGAGNQRPEPNRAATVGGGPPSRTASGDERTPLLGGDGMQNGESR